MKKLCLDLITGNANKAKEFKKIMSPNFELNTFSISLLQIQGSFDQIVKFKAREGYKLIGGNVIIEDTSLGFNAYNGMPGSYIKWFLRTLGPEGLFKMIQHHSDKTAFAQCSIGFMNKDMVQPKVFTGRTNGTIVKPRGNSGFGWDSIFQPEGHSLTYAEMNAQQKNGISHRYIAIQKLNKYLLETYP